MYSLNSSERLNHAFVLNLQSSLIKKAEDTEVDTAEQSAIKLRAQQQTSNALVVTDQHPANGAPPPVPVGQLSLVKVPSMISTEVSSFGIVVATCFLGF